MQKAKQHGIGWLENGFTWNPISGCTKISPGCANCYAETMAKTRLRGRHGYPKDDPFKLTYHPNQLEKVKKKKKGKSVFVCSMSDLFHEDVPDVWIGEVWAAMHQAPQHTYHILTKRPGRLRQMWKEFGWHFPPNIRIGVSAENWKLASKRIWEIIDMPAFRFVNLEPLIARVTLNALRMPGWDFLYNPLAPCKHDIKNFMPLNWVIVGGESGKGFANIRPTETRWVMDIHEQCKENKVPFYFKQWGTFLPVIKFINNAGIPGYISPHNSEEFGNTWDEFYRPSPMNPDQGWLNMDKKKAGNMLQGKLYEQVPQRSDDV